MYINESNIGIIARKLFPKSTFVNEINILIIPIMTTINIDANKFLNVKIIALNSAAMGFFVV